MQPLWLALEYPTPVLRELARQVVRDAGAASRAGARRMRLHRVGGGGRRRGAGGASRFDVRARTEASGQRGQSMNVQQQAEASAPMASVWDFLQQPERLVRVLPACVGVKAGEDGSLVATFDVHAMGLHERFDAHFTRYDERPGVLPGQGKGLHSDGPDFRRGDLRLEPIAPGTRILVSGTAQVSGLLAALGMGSQGTWRNRPCGRPWTRSWPKSRVDPEGFGRATTRQSYLWPGDRAGGARPRRRRNRWRYRGSSKGRPMLIRPE